MAGPGLAVTVASATSKVLFTESAYDFFFKWKLDTSLLDKLKMQVNSAKALLSVAEMRPMEEGPFVDAWIPKARYAILDAEDLLDFIFTDINKEKYRSGDSRGTRVIIKEKLRYKAKDIFRTVHPFKMTREAEMRKIIGKLQNITDQATHLGLDKTNDFTKFREDRMSTSSDIDPSNIIGRSDNEKDIIDLLNVKDDVLRVIPIIGMGGVGKTTLASMVYNKYATSEESDNVFQLRGWVCVSDKFEVINVIKSLFQSITGRDSKASNDLEFLQNELKKVLKDKKFLIVLDDIWTDVKGKWEMLQTVFSVGAPGSRIVVTTREKQVVDIVSNSCSPYKLDGLTYAQCWSLFQMHAFRNGDSSAFPSLEKIGKQIVGKCKGSPLAVKMLGRVLFSMESNEKDWEFVLDSKIWNSTSNILPSLWLSYYHLPLPVKQCFAYLSVFPKDYLFSMENVVQLWMAEGFVDTPWESSNDYEHVAQKYFKHLRSNFFLQERKTSLLPESTTRKSLFVMHDLIHDLAEYVSKDLLVDAANMNKEARRMSYKKEQESLFTMSAIRELSHLRTFLPSISGQFVNDKVCDDLMLNLKSLRVLSLEGFNISALPLSVGDMKLLRYLNISNTAIEYLPQSIGRIFNLQTLLLANCRRLKRLPANLCDLVNLRYLDTANTELEMMFDGIGGMTSLRKLTKFSLGKGKSKQMKEFKNLNNLHGELSISGLDNVDDVEDVATAKLENKAYLEKLFLDWGPTEDRDTTLDKKVLRALQPQANLKELKIYRYGGIRLSNWIVGVATSLISLHVGECFNCVSLPSLGDMRFLEKLVIDGLDCLDSLDEKFYGDTLSPFRALQELRISRMKSLKRWSFPRGDRKGFSCLKKLEIEACSELTEIPYCFPVLIEIRIQSCNALMKLDLCSDVEEGTVSSSSTRGLGRSLQSVYIDHCPKLENIPEGFVNLIRVNILNCDSLVSVPRLQHLRELVFRNRPALLPVQAAIQECAKLEILDINEEMLLLKDFDDDAKALRLPPYLWSLKIEDGIHTKILTEICQLKSVALLHFSKCPNLEYFKDAKAPSTLYWLFLDDCRALRTISDQFFTGCWRSLTDLTINLCPNLECLPTTMLESLTSLEIGKCPLIRTLSTSSGIMVFRNLKILRISDCAALESLPHRFPAFTALRNLSIADCPNLVLPAHRFPDNLLYIELRNCRKMEPISKMNLAKLTSLSHLDLEGFPGTLTLDHCLPEQIQYLTITNFPRLKSLPKVLGYVRVSSCPLLDKNKSWSTRLKGLPRQLISCNQIA